MAFLVMIVRKMIKNKWLELSLLLGLILGVALVGSMPVYTHAILQRMLVKDLERIQIDTNNYPGSLTVGYYFNDEKPDVRTALIKRFDGSIGKTAQADFNIPLLYYTKERRTPIMSIIPKDTSRYDSRVNRAADIGALEGVEDHIRLLDGRLPAKEQPVNGAYEVLITQQVIFDLKIAVGAEYVYKNKSDGSAIIVKPVGVFDKKDDSDIYWNNNTIKHFSTTFLVPYPIFERDFTSGEKGLIRSLHYNVVLDYPKMKVVNVNDYLFATRKLNQLVGNHGYVRAISYDMIDNSTEREAKLQKLLWSMNVPVIIMLAFYLYMVANLIMDRQKNEIAVLRSRGAGRLQIMISFLIEGAFLSVIALFAGPFVSLLLTAALGTSNGFLEFVQRTSLDVHLDKTAYLYGFYAVSFGLIMVLIPGFIATRASIVGHKQQSARKQKSSLWHKLFLDFILIAISIYGLRSFNQRIKDLTASGLDSSQFSIDPLLFLVPTLFTVGTGLFCLRFYPLFIRGIYWIGRKWWPPSLYSMLIQVGRSGSQYQFLMIFLIMTIATGLFSASAARTINQNNEDKVSYQYGTDIVLSVKWENNAPPPVPFPMSSSNDSATIKPRRIQYMERDYTPIVKDLPGVEHAAKVFTKSNATFSISGTNGVATLMGIDTDDFGKTAWFKNGLLDHHFNEYLNLIALEPKAVLVSRSLAENLQAKPGDQINIGWEMVEPRTFVIYGIIDYFPTFQPNPVKPGDPQPYLVVGHLDTIQTLLATEPYDIWLKLKPGADRAALVNELQNRKVPLVNYMDVKSALIRVKNDPFQLAINGVMTLGFIISIIVSFCGFLLYWVLSLHGRVLQIGIFRAMGISFKQLVSMLIAEQVLTSGAGILIGIFDGYLSSRLFVEFFQLTFNPATQVPPFQVVHDPRDWVGLLVMVAIMMISGLSILAFLLTRIKIHQAVKLGED